MKLTITAYSTPLFSTWYFIKELGLLFDAGDGVAPGLFSKSRKSKHVFISHILHNYYRNFEYFSA